MKQQLVLLCLSLPMVSAAQKDCSGEVCIGLRGNLNPFPHYNTSWIGFGAQLQVKVARRFNSEWSVDYYPSVNKSVSERKDLRISATALYYPIHEIYSGKFYTPYFSIGINSAFTQVSGKVGIANPNQHISDQRISYQPSTANRWSFGIVAGIGMLLHVTPKINVGIVTQYLGQVGTAFKSSTTNNTADNSFSTTLPDNNLNYEGQLVFTMSVNYSLGELW